LSEVTTGPTATEVSAGTVIDAPQPASKVEFSPDQQSWINQREKAHKEELKSLKETLSSFESKLAKLDPESFNNRLNQAAQKNDKDTQVELLMNKIRDMEQSQLENSIQSSIRGAIDEAGVDPKYSRFVQDYVKTNIQYEEGQIKVVSPQTKAQRFSKDGTRALSVADIVAEALAEYPAFAPKAPTGSGARVNDVQNQGQQSLSQQLKTLDPRNPADQVKLKALLQQQIDGAAGGSRTLNVLKPRR
jgi:hypothetical protein